ncbi:MAG: IS3 family transposase [Bdellovibrionales bacterium]|nr:IS3 family transposase [Bdellovibrionales bacterium]
MPCRYLIYMPIIFIAPMSLPFLAKISRQIVFKTEAELRALVFEYIETWYNKKRLDSSIGYQSPTEYESTLNAA